VNLPLAPGLQSLVKPMDRSRHIRPKKLPITKNNPLFMVEAELSGTSQSDDENAPGLDSYESSFVVDDDHVQSGSGDVTSMLGSSPPVGRKMQSIYQKSLMTQVGTQMGFRKREKRQEVHMRHLPSQRLEFWKEAGELEDISM